MTLQLTHTNTVNTDKFNKGINSFVGISAWVNDTDGSYIYFPIFDDNTETVPSDSDVIGYSYAYTSYTSSNVFIRSDAQINLPIYGSLTVDEIVNHADYGTYITATEIRDENTTLIGLTDIKEYSNKALFWQGLNSYDTNDVNNRIDGGSDIAITNGSVLNFNGVDNYTVFTINRVGTIISGNGHISLNPVNGYKHTVAYITNNGVGFQFRIDYLTPTSATYVTIERVPSSAFKGSTPVSFTNSNFLYFEFNWNVTNGTVDWVVGDTSGTHSNLSLVATPSTTTIRLGSFGANFEPFKGNYYDATFLVDDVIENNFLFGEGVGSTIFDKMRNNDATIQGTTSNIWQFSDDQYPYNLEYGFDLWINGSEYLRVPYDVNGLPIKTDGDVLSGYTWVCSCPSGNDIWNRSENKFDLTSFGYSPLTVDEIVNHSDTGSKIFFERVEDDNGTLIGIKNVLVYSSAITGDCRTKTEKSIGNTTYQVLEGAYQVIEGDYIIKK